MDKRLAAPTRERDPEYLNKQCDGKPWKSHWTYSIAKEECGDCKCRQNTGKGLVRLEDTL